MHDPWRQRFLWLVLLTGPIWVLVGIETVRGGDRIGWVLITWGVAKTPVVVLLLRKTRTEARP